MSQPSQHILPLRQRAAVIAAAALAAAVVGAMPAAARADLPTQPSPPATTVSPASSATVPATFDPTTPSTSAAQLSQAAQPNNSASPVVRLLRLPATVDSQALAQLTKELNTAASPDTLILIPPTPVTIALTATGNQLAGLAQASMRARLVIVRPPGNLLSEFRQAQVRFTAYDSARALAGSLGMRRPRSRSGSRPGPWPVCWSLLRRRRQAAAFSRSCRSRSRWR